MCFNTFTTVTKTCPDLGLLGHGEIRYNTDITINGSYPVGTRANYSCQFGYSLYGAERNFCSESGIWEEKRTLCIGKKLKAGSK